MEMGDMDVDFDWSEVDILSSMAPSLLNNSANVPQQVNVSNVQDSVGTVDATPNMTQNTEPTFNYREEANSSSVEGIPPLLAVNDSYQLPQLSPNASAPLMNETDQSNFYVPSMVGLTSEGAGSSVQGQNMTTPMNYYNQFPLMQNNNLPLMHDMGQLNEYNTNNRQSMLANQNFNGTNPQSSSYQPSFQQNPVQAGAGNGTTNGQYFMSNQTSQAFGLNNHGINELPSAWNSPRSLWAQDEGNPLLQNPGFQQQRSTSNGTTPLSSGFAASSGLNSAILGLPGTRLTGGSSSQFFNPLSTQFANLLSRPERAPGLQLRQQVSPLSVNRITPRRVGNGLSISSSFSARAQTSVPNINILNRNGRSTFGSYGSYSTLQPRGLREPPRRGRPRKHFEPSEVTPPPCKRRKRENPGKTPLSREDNAYSGVVIRDDPNPSSSSSAAPPREYINAMYDPAFERAGLPIDPILRLFKARSEKPAEPGNQN